MSWKPLCGGSGGTCRIVMERGGKCRKAQKSCAKCCRKVLGSFVTLWIALQCYGK